MSQNEFLLRLAGPLRNRFRIAVIQERMWAELLLLHIERIQLRWFGHLILDPCILLLFYGTLYFWYIYGSLCYSDSLCLFSVPYFLDCLCLVSLSFLYPSSVSFCFFPICHSNLFLVSYQYSCLHSTWLSSATTTLADHYLGHISSRSTLFSLCLPVSLCKFFAATSVFSFCIQTTQFLLYN